MASLKRELHGNLFLIVIVLNSGLLSRVSLHIGVVVIILLLSLNAAGATDLSFSSARALLQERNNALKASEANAESKKMAAESLKWLHGPTIEVGAVELWGQAKIDVDRSISIPAGSMPVDIKENYNISGPRAAVTGTMPLFTGGKIGAAQKAAQYGAEEARALHGSKINQLDAELVSKYFGLQFAISLQNLRQATLAEENEQLARALKFEKQGMLSSVEVMGIRVARDTAERELLKARNAVRTAKLELQRLLLKYKLGVLSTPLFVLRSSIEPMEEWVRKALDGNPQLAVADARVNQADEGVNASRSSWFPQVMAFGQYYFAKPHQTYIRPDWLAGVGVNMTLWDARDRLADFKSARAGLREACSAKADAQEMIRTNTETAWMNTQNAREQYMLTASNVKLARANPKLKSEGFDEGLYTALDVTQARDQLLVAEVERRVAAFDFVMNYALLHVLAGNMEDFMKSSARKDVLLEK